MAGFEYLDSFARLAVSDLDSAIRWYADAIGFQLISRADPRDGEGGLAHLRRSEGQDLVLVASQPRSAPQADRANGGGLALHFAVDASLEELARTARDAGARVEPATASGHSARDAVRVFDPDRHEFVFFRRVTPRRPLPDPN